MSENNVNESKEVFVEENQVATEKKENIIKKFFKYLEQHEDFRQVVFFMLFSMLCFAAEMISYYSINAICAATGFTEEFKWFVFDYSAANSGGIGGFLAFLISTTIAQILTFILNRKKTFRATNNVVWSAIMYTVMVIAIIIANAALCGVIKAAIMDAMLAAKIDNGISDFVAGTVSKMVGGALSWVISFLMSKFVIMRSPKAKNVATETENAESVEASEE